MLVLVLSPAVSPGHNHHAYEEAQAGHPDDPQGGPAAGAVHEVVPFKHARGVGPAGIGSNRAAAVDCSSDDAGMVVAAIVPAVLVVQALVGSGKEIDGHDYPGACTGKAEEEEGKEDFVFEERRVSSWVHESDYKSNSLLLDLRSIHRIYISY